jgi:hypothetical protein
VKLPILTQSELRTYRRCAREHTLAYRQGLRSVEPDAAPLRFGTAIHQALACWWAGFPLAEAIEAINGLDDPFELARASALFAGYVAHWRKPAGSVLLVEKEFRCALTNPATGADSRTFELAGKIDALTVLGGRTLLVEHKTTSEDIAPGSPYWQRLRIDTQIPIYLRGVESLGHRCDGVLYDVLAKPKLRPKKGERAEDFQERCFAEVTDHPERYYAQVELPILTREIDDAMADAWATARAIRESELSGRWPRNSDACVRWSRPCAYFGLCTGQRSASSFVQTDPHPELNTP